MKLLDKIRLNKGFSFILFFSTFIWMLSVFLFIFSNNISRSEIVDVESKRALDHYENVLHNIFDQLTRIEVFVETVGVTD